MPFVSHLNREQSNDKGVVPYGECRSTAETVHGELGIAERSEKLFNEPVWVHPDSNRGPSPCEGDVITARPWTLACLCFMICF